MYPSSVFNTDLSTFNLHRCFIKKNVLSSVKQFTSSLKGDILLVLNDRDSIAQPSQNTSLAMPYFKTEYPPPPTIVPAIALKGN